MPETPADRFTRTVDSASDPARDAFMVAPSDSAALPRLPKALLIGVGGRIVLRAVDSNADVAVSVVAGQIVPIRPSHVRATGTTAGEIVALA